MGFHKKSKNFRGRGGVIKTFSRKFRAKVFRFLWSRHPFFEARKCFFIKFFDGKLANYIEPMGRRLGLTLVREAFSMK